MKKFTFLFFAVLSLLCSGSLLAQKANNGTYQRCGTMEAIEEQLRTDPDFRARWEQGMRDYEESLENPNARTGRVSTLTSPVTIPVVVHIVLPNPNVVTDADVEFFINRLNQDFSGLNPDSANGAPFYSVRGHSLIRFQLAKRDPSGNLTNGIERKVGNVLIGGGEPQPIKSAASGGLNPWDYTQYYNLWVGDASGGLLGIAPAIGVGTAASDGVCVYYGAFAGNSCITIPEFSLARTAVHEIGHNFGLFHTFQGTCAATNDFGQLTTAGCQLPADLLGPADDTPAQPGATSGCPTTAQSVCAGVANPPGRMYQNFMDYTDDACYSMFTIGQVERMHYVLEFCRPGYLTTQGHLPPPGAIALDAAPMESVNPGGYELQGCNVINYPANMNCGGSFTAKFRVKNNGTSTITSIGFGYRLDSDPAVVMPNIAVNIPSGGTVVVNLGTINVSPGAHTIRYFTTNPNNGTDEVTANDTLVTNFNVASGTALPVSQDFTSATFPPSGWSVANPDNGITWVRSNSGSGAAGSAYINIYNYSARGQKDDLVSPALDVSGFTDSLIVTFRVAHKTYGGSFGPDTLELVYSPDCGATWLNFGNYKKWSNGPAGNNLSTGPNTTSNFVPVASEWRQERVAMKAPFPGNPGSIQIAWRSIHQYGNNLYIDDINIEKKASRDIRVLAINTPSAEVCSGNFIPSVVVNNPGEETVTSFEVGYSIDGGTPVISGTISQTLAPGASAVIDLAAVNTSVGPHVFEAWTQNPTSGSGTGDLSPLNDTMSLNFTVNAPVNSPITEGFEAAAFPPAGWTLLNPNSNNTWVRRTPGSNSAASMFINNYDYNLVNEVDELKSPTVNTSGLDSVIFSFDVAARCYSATLADTLLVYASADCGVTWTAVYRKWGTDLGPASTSNYLAPAASDWRTERIALADQFVGGSVIFKVTNNNQWGNNIFVDNINITGVFGRDASLVSINNPTSVICSETVTPSVTVGNPGRETITAFNVSYSINGGPVSTTNVTGVSLEQGETIDVTLNAGNVGLGNHVIEAWVWDPVTGSGTGDPNPLNDTLTKQFGLAGNVEAPLNEGFESGSFPPANWASVNSDGSITWDLSSSARTGSGSAFVRNYEYPSLGQVDDLYTPNINYNGVDSVTLSFDVAAVTYSYPGSTSVPLDTLEVLVTTDCGNSFTTIYKKWGEDLQTIGNPNYPQTTEFYPNSNQWRSETIDLSGYTPDGPIQIVFRNTTNYENNIFIDNVNVTTRTLPARLKTDGFMILPTPFQDRFTIMHYQQPTTLRFAAVYNSAGQMVWSKRFSGDADKNITVDLSSRAAGVYTVHLGYEDSNRNVQTRVVKY